MLSIFFKKYVFLFVGACLFIYILILTMLVYVLPDVNRFDFSIYLQGVHRILENKPLYDLQFNATKGFNYSTSVVPFILLFIFLPTLYAASVWNFISLLLFLSTIFIWVKILQMKPNFLIFFFLAAISLLLAPVLDTLSYGQINFFVLFFLTISFILSQSKSRENLFLSGMFMGLAAAAKLFPLAMLLYFLCKKQWISMISTLLFFTLFLLVGTFGRIHYAFDFISYVFKLSHFSQQIVGDLSLSSILFQYVPLQKQWLETMTVAIFICSQVLSIGSWLLARRKKVIMADFCLFSSLLACTVLLITPLAWTHHLVFVLPLSFYLLFLFMQTKKIQDLIMFLLCSFLIFLYGADVYVFFHVFTPTWNVRYINTHALVGLFLALGSNYWIMRFHMPSKTVTEQANHLKESSLLTRLKKVCLT